MKKNMKKIRVVFGFLVFAGILNQKATAQATNGIPANNNFAVGSFVGWNATNGINHLPFKTNNVDRMMINGAPAPFSINGQPAIARSGFLGLGNSTFFIPLPLSLPAPSACFILTA